METFHAFLPYLGIGLAGILGLLLLVWLVFSVRIMLKTKGIPQAIDRFFTLIAEGKIPGAYQLTADDFKAKISKQQFTKFIKKYKFHKYKRTTMSIPKLEGNLYYLDVEVILQNNQEIPVTIALIKNNKDWQVAELKYNYQLMINN